MSTAIDYLAQHGLSVRKKGGRVVISPRSQVTDDIQKYVRAHRLALLAELASNDGQARRMHWVIQVPGYPAFTMIGEPCTHAEALAHARGIWPDADIY